MSNLIDNTDTEVINLDIADTVSRISRRPSGPTCYVALRYCQHYEVIAAC